MLRRVFLYCLRGWKKSVTLLVMCAVLFSVLLALFPIRRAASSAAESSKTPVTGDAGVAAIVVLAVVAAAGAAVIIRKRG